MDKKLFSAPRMFWISRIKPGTMKCVTQADAMKRSSSYFKNLQHSGKQK